MPYLHDADQEAARRTAPGPRPTCSCSTPPAGSPIAARPTPNYGDKSQQAAWLREALDDLLAGREVARPETEPVGCSVKWRGQTP